VFWDKVKAFYHEDASYHQNYREEWVELIKSRQELEGYFKQYKIKDDLLLRVCDPNLPVRDKEPKALACYHASREINYPHVSVETLREDFDKGNRLLQQ
jgi:hypothetical protein